METNLLGYQDAAQAAELAIFGGEHLLIVGPPGTGKSLFADQLLSQLEGTAFKTQLSKWSDETALFGPPNLSALRNKGALEYGTKGTILGANWAFVDEIFDASDVLLRTLLGILNERQFSRGSFAADVPLITCIATSNFTRSNEQTEAIVDRFALRCEAPSLSDQQRRALWTSDYKMEWEPPTPFTLAQIRAVQTMARRIEIPPPLVKLGAELAKEHGWSPRRERKAAWLCQVRAELGVRKKVEYDDLAVVLPFLIPLGEGLAGRQKALSQKLEDTAERMRKEEDLIASIRTELGVGKAARSASPSTVVHLRILTRCVKTLRNISVPSSYAKATAEKKEALDAVQAWHRELMENLEVIP